MSERLQKIISRAGIASRRKAEEYILAGRVSVNGTVVQELGSKADWTVDTIQIDGQKIEKAPEHRYLILNKPKGYITSTSDPKGRRTVMDLLGKHACRGLFPVGRLDYNTEGLLIITNDGEFANSITSARNKVPKTYQIKVNGRPAKELIDKLRRGITLDNRPIRPESIDLIRSSDNPWYELTLIQGRNRQIHRMFERIGFLIEKIRRVRIGSLTIKNMKPGEVRILKSRELQALQYSGASTHHKVPVADTPKRPTTTQTHKPPQTPKHSRASLPQTPNPEVVRNQCDSRENAESTVFRSICPVTVIAVQTIRNTPTTTSMAPTQRLKLICSCRIQRARIVSMT